MWKCIANSYAESLCRSGSKPLLPYTVHGGHSVSFCEGRGSACQRWACKAPWATAFLLDALQKLEGVLQRDVGHGRGLDGLCRSWILVPGFQNKVAGFDRSSHHPSAVAVGNEALSHSGTHVPHLLGLQLFGEVLLAFHPFLHLVHCNGEALVLIVASIPRLCCLGNLGFFDQLPDGHLPVAILLTQSLAVRVGGDGETVRWLHIAVASQGSQQCRVASIEVGIVARPPWADPACSSFPCGACPSRRPGQGRSGRARQSTILSWGSAVHFVGSLGSRQ